MFQVWLQDSQGVQLECQEQSQQGLWRELLLHLQRWRWCLLQWTWDKVTNWSENSLFLDPSKNVKCLLLRGIISAGVIRSSLSVDCYALESLVYIGNAQNKPQHHHDILGFRGKLLDLVLWPPFFCAAECVWARGEPRLERSQPQTLYWCVSTETWTRRNLKPRWVYFLLSNCCFFLTWTKSCFSCFYCCKVGTFQMNALALWVFPSQTGQQLSYTCYILCIEQRM